MGWRRAAYALSGVDSVSGVDNVRECCTHSNQRNAYIIEATRDTVNLVFPLLQVCIQFLRGCKWRSMSCGLRLTVSKHDLRKGCQ